MMGLRLAVGYGCATTLLWACSLDWREAPPNAAPIVDRDGRIVVYHGLSVANVSKSTADHLPWHEAEDFARMRDWGFNLVRLLVFWEAVEPEPGAYDEAYLDAVVARIAWMEELGIDVLVDFHQDLYNRRFGGNGFPDWTVRDEGKSFTRRAPWGLNYLEPAVRASYRNFWTSPELQAAYVDMMAHVLERVDGLPNVVGLEIINEPWPAGAWEFEREALGPFYEAADAMRTERGFETPLYFEPVIYTSAGIPSRLRFEPEGAAVYAAHYYDPFCHEGGPYGAFGAQLMRTALERRVREANRFGTPMMYTEFGISPDVEGYDRYLRDILGLLDARQVSWVYYAYDKREHSTNGIVEADKTPSPVLAPLVQVYAQRIAGRDPAWTRRPGAFELTYAPVDTGAPTVIFAPGDLRDVRATVDGEAVAFAHPETLYLEVPARDGAERRTVTLTWAE